MGNSEGHIQYLHNSAIDVVRWDSLIKWSPNGRSYAMSWYLDILHPDWHGLVYGDYEYVMPVISSSKLGIRYAYQPVYGQQHGIFPPANPEVKTLFIGELKKRFRLIEISFNAYNQIPAQAFEISYRKNYLLSLYNPYPVIREGYSNHTSRYVQKAKKEVSVMASLDLEGFVKLKSRFGGKNTTGHLAELKLIIAHAIARKEGILYFVYDNHNQVCGAAFFLKEKGRYTYLSSVSSPEGKKLRAMFALIDRFIFDHANQPFLLDFEGSENEGIARFFAGFGAIPEYYPKVKYNRLPKWIRWMKP
jgi:hypothetical protein